MCCKTKFIFSVSQNTSSLNFNVYNMVRAWYIDDSGISAAKADITRLVDIKDVESITGLLYYKIDVSDLDNDAQLRSLKQERGYHYSDTISVDGSNADPEMMRDFFREHMHSDEEIRAVLDGNAYFDVRDVTDKWIRVLVEKGDLLILPTGIYHRFKLADQNTVRVLRLFTETPSRVAHYRPADSHPARKQYEEFVQTQLLTT